MAINNNQLWIIALIAVLIFLSQSPIDQPKTDDSGSDLSNIVDSSVAFTSEDKHSRSVDLTGETVRVFKINGMRDDLGTYSLNSGVLNTVPNQKYRLYYLMNRTAPSSTYYVDVKDYTAPVQEAQDTQKGMNCQIDTSLTYSAQDSAGNTQSASTFAQSLTINEDVDLSIRIKVGSDECFGTPGAPKTNALCFAYNSTAISLIETKTSKIGVPVTVASNETTETLSCYSLPLMEDNQVEIMNLHIRGGSAEPTNAHNITVYAQDIGFDLNGDTLEEIWDYQDEQNNDLGSTLQNLGEIYIS